MARTKAHEFAPKPFTLKDNTIKPLKDGKPTGFPNTHRDQLIMASEENRSFAAQVIRDLRMCWNMPKVNSNAELVERIGEYFDLMADKETPLTVEAMMLFCGYNTAYLYDWTHGSKAGWTDPTPAGSTTSEILKNVTDLLHAYDASLANSFKMNTASYIWRSKQYYGCKEPDKGIVLKAHDSALEAPKTPEEIMLDLPEPDEWRKSPQVEVEAEVR